MHFFVIKFVPLAQTPENDFGIIPSRFGKFKWYPGGGVSERKIDISPQKFGIFIFRAPLTICPFLSFLAGFLE